MSIKKINFITTQALCANQVIISMSDAIKELIENSLDAKADKIEIRLKNFGADLIEVQDNGIGIADEDLNDLTTAHSTSKLNDFIDLSNLATFGFRGEALHALCAMGIVEIHTNTNNCVAGTLISYDKCGSIISRSALARRRGTTVTVRTLFYQLPVRRRQLLTNVRREYDKALQMVTAFCVGAMEAEILVYNEGRDQKSSLVITNGSTRRIRSNIEAVFGIAQSKQLLDVSTDHNIPTSVIGEFSVTDIDYVQSVKVEGCVSRPQDGTGRAAPDRQFIFINDRPCHMPAISKLVSRCYRDTAHASNCPVFAVSVRIPPDSFDINIEPSKCVVLFKHPQEVLAVIQASLLSAFSRFGCSRDSRSIDTSQREVRVMTSFLNLPEKRQPSPIQSSTPKRPKIDDSAPIDSQRRCSVPDISGRDARVHFSLDSLSTCHRSVTLSEGAAQSLFQAKIVPDDNANAEAELRLIFKKENFLAMESLGQFNSGFIVCRLGDDLFIIDQHASDERRRFEMLLDSCVVESQPLVLPIRLLLGAGGSQLVLDNLGTFERCGFKFTGNVDKGLLLTAVCCRNGLMLGVRDVIEMLEAIRTCGGSQPMLVPSRIRAAVASNACRGAIMIGRSLSRSEMAQVISRMATLVDPWQCAHGRPTMRHLCALSSRP